MTNPTYKVQQAPTDFRVVDVRSGAVESTSTSRVRAQATAAALNAAAARVTEAPIQSWRYMTEAEDREQYGHSAEILA